ncbi:hypothetical protein SCHPADRAFT_897387, partial [Schizopora paradoxa]
AVHFQHHIRWTPPATGTLLPPTYGARVQLSSASLAKTAATTASNIELTLHSVCIESTRLPFLGAGRTTMFAHTNGAASSARILLREGGDDAREGAVHNLRNSTTRRRGYDGFETRWGRVRCYEAQLALVHDASIELESDIARVSSAFESSTRAAVGRWTSGGIRKASFNTGCMRDIPFSKPLISYGCHFRVA